MNSIKDIIDEWDPVDILAVSPDDEYLSEVLAIKQLLRKTQDVNKLGEGIYNIFLYEFGESVFNKSKEECVKIAGLILGT